MTNKQLTKLLSLYKLSVKKQLSAAEFSDLIKQAKINIDRSFVQSGKEDTNLGDYLNELVQLKELQDEQS